MVNIVCEKALKKVANNGVIQVKERKNWEASWVK